ncbi:MAG: hypothetical protein IKE24_02615 [Clostridia bacterium]|nr:hypothetical protein [Clostridia bacterium]
MEGTQQETQKVKLFREKSLEAVESPEALNDYLRVTSPGVWIVLSAVILVLIGGILWAVFGHVDTSLNLAVVSGDSGIVCYIPYTQMESVMASGSVQIDGRDYPLQPDEDARLVTVAEDMNPFVRVAGDLRLGDVTVETRLGGELPVGIYTGSVVTESLRPISLLLPN